MAGLGHNKLDSSTVQFLHLERFLFIVVER